MRRCQERRTRVKIEIYEENEAIYTRWMSQDTPDLYSYRKVTQRSRQVAISDES